MPRGDRHLLLPAALSSPGWVFVSTAGSLPCFKAMDTERVGPTTWDRPERAVSAFKKWFLLLVSKRRNGYSVKHDLEALRLHPRLDRLAES